MQIAEPIQNFMLYTITMSINLNIKLNSDHKFIGNMQITKSHGAFCNKPINRVTIQRQQILVENHHSSHLFNKSSNIDAETDSRNENAICSCIEERSWTSGSSSGSESSSTNVPPKLLNNQSFLSSRRMKLCKTQAAMTISRWIWKEYWGASLRIGNLLFNTLNDLKIVFLRKQCLWLNNSFAFLGNWLTPRYS